MPTKTNVVGPKTMLESENTRKTNAIRNDWVGTAIELLRALEETDETINSLSVFTQLGSPKVEVRTGYEMDGNASGVPEPLHQQLLDYGYQHAGEDGTMDYSHTDERSGHVYIKD